MPKSAKPSSDQPFSPPGMARCFEHPDGRTYSIQVIDCRLYESWGGPKGGGGGNTSTRDDNEDAQRFAHAKMRSLLKKGFVEGASRPGLDIDPEADVIDTLRTDVDYAGKTRYDFQPIAGRRLMFAMANISVAEWLMASDDRRLGVLVMCKVHNSLLPPQEREAMAASLLDVLEELRAGLFADRETPVRVFPLPRPVGRFTRLVVLSPTVEHMTISRNVNIQSHVLARSLYRAFPAFPCEVMGTEGVGLAEARCSGRASIPMNTWDRRPHPVFDLAYLKKPDERPEFLVFNPAEIDRRLSTETLARFAALAVLARNHAGEVRRFAKGDTTDLGELRRFFCGDDA